MNEFPLLQFILFVAMLVTMFNLESFMPARKWHEKRSKRVWFSLALALINNIFLKLLLATPFLWFTLKVEEQGLGLSRLLGLPLFIEIPLTVILFDFFIYWQHRWFHRVPLFWRFHRVHHTDQHLDSLTALRYHPGELIFSLLFKSLWIIIWGPSALGFLGFEIALNTSSQFHHSNISLGNIDKYFSKLLVSPKFHLIHHTIMRDKGDQNFSTIFSFWDKLFSTYSDPETSQENLMNLKTFQPQPLSLVEVLKSPFKS